MKTIPLRGKKAAGRVALVDDEDYDLVMQYRWYIKFGRNGVMYAYRLCEAGRRKSQGMHALITGFARTDHRNHDGLDNQRRNLRDGTGSRNAWNTRKLAPATSRFKGVSWDSSRGKWAAKIEADHRHVSLGYWTVEERAALAYDSAARVLHGEYAVLNFPDPDPSAADGLPPEVSRANKDKTHCIHGHEFTPENTYWYTCKNGNPGRMCKECVRRSSREFQRKRRAKAAAARQAA